jgi:hypothetical protein
MSYEPNIYFRKKDLEKHRSKIEAAPYDTIANMPARTEKQREKRTNLELAYKELENALKREPIAFKEIKFIRIHPELTSHNQRVRELLDELGVEYVTEI